MKSSTEKLPRQWLSEHVIPLWREKGVDPVNGGFVESLTRAGLPTDAPRRAMVQARQIYAFTEAAHMGVLSADAARSIVARAGSFLLEHYSQGSGAFVHSVDPAGKPVNAETDLYSQAFVLFGLAHAYAMTSDQTYKKRAKTLLDYLQRERRVAAGGYSEIVKGEIAYQANPHMHLFEAAIAWLAVDADDDWRALAKEVFVLCRERFFDRDSGGLCENFDASWKPIVSDKGFVFEPGHHCEWAWLLLKYEAVSGVPVGTLPARLFEVSEAVGLRDGLLIDEVWSNLNPKKLTSRFWPQGERVKAAVLLGSRGSALRRDSYARAADEAMAGLFQFFASPAPGLWEDTRLENGTFTEQPVKASSLYHIINAIAEYSRLRPSL